MDKIEEIKGLSIKNPVIAPMPLHATCMFPEFDVYDEFEEFMIDYHNPDYRFDRKVLIIDDVYNSSIPRVDAENPNVNNDLNTILDWSSDRCHEILPQRMICQSELSDYITRDCSSEVVVLIVVDGIRYSDVKDISFDDSNFSCEIQPVFVDGISETNSSHNRIILGSSNGDERQVSDIAYKLSSERKYRNSFGFTYWDEDDYNKLSNKLYESIVENNRHKIKKFDNVLSYLDNVEIDQRTYIQVTKMGIDQDIHRKKEYSPNISRVIDDVKNDLENLSNLLSDKGLSFDIYLTGDHGILLEKEIDNRKVVDDWPSRKARYCGSEINIGEGMIYNGMTGLAYPYFGREKPHINEWGYHGGFSYQESVVPLMKIHGGGSS